MLGPLLFLLYTAELFDIIAGTGLTSHSYADDTQLYSAPAPFVMTTVQQFVWSVEKVDAWMSSNRLKMNADKTQLLARYTTTAGQADCHRAIAAVCIRVQLSTTVSDLGVLVDGQLNMADHVASSRPM